MSHHFVIVLPSLASGPNRNPTVAHNLSTQSPALFDTREAAHAGALDSSTIHNYAVAPATLHEDLQTGGYTLKVDTKALEWISTKAARVAGSR
jgi:hypothetical protein